MVEATNQAYAEMGLRRQGCVNSFRGWLVNPGCECLRKEPKRMW
jgi:hypothetical protein